MKATGSVSGDTDHSWLRSEDPSQVRASVESVNKQKSMVTVAEAARICHRSESTVRRWCREGQLLAKKTQSGWLIDEQDVPTPSQSHEFRSDVMDFDQAWEHIRNHDLKQDTWIPDCLQFGDWIADSEALVESAQESVSGTYRPDTIRIIRVPKTGLLTRAGGSPSLRDRVVFQAAVSPLAPRIESMLSTNVFSARHAEGNRKYFFRKSTTLHGDFVNRTRDAIEDGYGIVAVTDVVSYFDNIDHSLLFRQLIRLDAPTEALNTLRILLRTWGGDGQTGIPQGPNASRLLGNLYLIPVDSAIENSNLDVVYTRFMDDIRVAARTSADARRAIALIETEMTKRGLTLSSSKTRIVEGQDLDQLLGDPEKQRIGYLLEAGRDDASREKLKAMLDNSLRRRDTNWSDFRFSLWRLAQLRDHGRLRKVLSRLDLLTPEASLVAAYVLPFLHQNRAMRAMASYLTDPDRNQSEYMAIWLSAALIEAPDLHPDLLVYARSTYRDRNIQRELRGVAASVAARHGNDSDIAAIEQIVNEETDVDLMRWFLVALRRRAPLRREMIDLAVARFPELVRTTRYLSERTWLPSLVYAGRRVDAG